MKFIINDGRYKINNRIHKNKIANQSILHLPLVCPHTTHNIFGNGLFANLINRLNINFAVHTNRIIGTYNRFTCFFDDESIVMIRIVRHFLHLVGTCN